MSKRSQHTTEPKLYVQLKKHEGGELKKKTLILIRHGESYWNQAQEDKNLVDMYKRCDHPLNANGVDQALELNKKWKKQQSEQESTPELQKFLSAQVILTSPLCRATQVELLCFDYYL
ncbi:hypothetical protein RFI_07348 [Reticulomyxa filosa]|uniref:Phosphoglycerate mutase family protein n=1 Tax=Reticulomyxa filosa TaxID=46433 RepID=X6NVE3_RETFI|nr:hypothetical protein RFI_07348 [Reticulomyxa filosa]|eukprot:ETO29774.1 hypothetical protein RFI_07348 [Reticulomyxa filosa]